ncbi:hypothetical protein [Plantactinospora sp. KBS50]|uniref:hypothetical protein n=1 Tax=Plantactinospora sp. KBS50 TaxID=2024580 RepID=UPI000BAB070E|nr:hypothetical protein [Plantactinospora sp. KBS50]ASW54795.1 hypothetical protein CIK06_12305 [Plantactinospora sp. KBS50]
MDRGRLGVIPLVAVFGVLPFSVWGLVYRNRCEPHLSMGAAVSLGVGHWFYSYLQSVAVWVAFGRLLASRSEWQKTDRVGDQTRRPGRARGATNPARPTGAATLDDAPPSGAPTGPHPPVQSTPANHPNIATKHGKRDLTCTS